MKACALLLLSMIAVMMIGSNAQAISCGEQHQRCLAGCNKAATFSQRPGGWCPLACAGRFLRAQETGRWEGPRGKFACTR